MKLVNKFEYYQHPNIRSERQRAFLKKLEWDHSGSSFPVSEMLFDGVVWLALNRLNENYNLKEWI